MTAPAETCRHDRPAGLWCFGCSRRAWPTVIPADQRTPANFGLVRWEESICSSVCPPLVAIITGKNPTDA